MKRDDWEPTINLDGLPTRVDSLGPPFENIMTCASSVVVAASGYENPDPGITVARLDPKDEPYIWNVDQYTVIQSLSLHPQFEDFVRTARVENSGELRAAIDAHVFILKRHEREIPDHWAKELPARVREAREREAR